jgi:hypothetical protein
MWRGRASARMTLAVAYGLADENARYAEPTEVAHSLVAACAEGKVTATGLQNGKGDRASIPRDWWNDARLSDGEAPYSIVAHARPGSCEWHDLLFDRGAIEQLWPKPQPAAVVAPAYVPFLVKEERRKGPKRPYVGELYRVLRWIRHQDGALYFGSSYTLAREVRRKWKSSAPALPAARDGRSTTLEAAIEQTREGLEADTAAGITPEFPSTALATASR